jgi:hypothetical protein
LLWFLSPRVLLTSSPQQRSPVLPEQATRLQPGLDSRVSIFGTPDGLLFSSSARHRRRYLVSSEADKEQGVTVHSPHESTPQPGQTFFIFIPDFLESDRQSDNCACVGYSWAIRGHSQRL